MRGVVKPSSRKAFSGIILPWLEYIYQLFLDPWAKKQKLVIEDEFWIFFGFAVFSFIIYFTGSNLYLPFGFLVAAILVLIIPNSDYFKRRFFPESEAMIEEYLNSLAQKDTDDLLRFIRQNDLSSQQLIKIFEKKQGNSDVYEFVLKHQLINQELLEYIVNKNRYLEMPEETFCKYITFSKNHLNKTSYYKIMKNTTKVRIIKTFNLNYPFYLENHKIFKFFARSVINIRNWANYGALKIVVLFISAILVGVNIIQNPPIHIAASAQGWIFAFVLINVFLGYVMAVVIVALILFQLYGVFMKFSRAIVYLFSPKSKQKL
jgi:hypothetical protein